MQIAEKINIAMAAESKVRVRTLCGDVFEFTSGTSEQDMSAFMADRLNIDPALLMLRRFAADEYLAFVDVDMNRDPTAYFVKRGSNGVYEVRTIATLKGTRYLPDGFLIRSVENGFQWVRHSQTYPSLRACIEAYCESTGWPLPSILFLEQIDARFTRAKCLSGFTMFRNYESPSMHILRNRREIVRIHSILQQFDPTRDWLEFGDNIYNPVIDSAGRLTRKMELSAICAGTILNMSLLAAYSVHARHWIHA